MKITERSYSGRVFRPRPEIHVEENGNLFVVAIPWGQRAPARRVTQTIVDFFHSAKVDEEVTSPFQVLSSLSPMANNLRVAVMLANDTLYREENRGEYLSGVELLVAAIKDNELVWAQAGGPHLLLDRPGWDLQYLSGSPDLALAHSDRHQLLSPLPSNLLGLAPTSNFQVHSFRLDRDDRLLLVNRTLLPPSLLSVSHEDRDINKLSTVLASHSADLPFWLGVLSF